MSKTFRQNDARWGNFVYTRGGSTMAHAGCGPTSIADIVCNNPKYKDITPKDVAKWLKEHGYNVQGTTWEGITKALEHYGFVVKSPNTMTALFDLLEKGLYKWGIINFDRGRVKGSSVTWTSGGHYVAFSSFKQENGQDYLYTRDPGARHNDGWHSYQKTMRGLCKKVWCCYLKDEEQKVVRTYDGKIMDISEHQGAISWNTCPTGHVIIRTSYTSTGSKFKLKKDKYFEKNFKGAKGRDVMYYHFSQAKTKEEARKEAQYMLKILQAKKVPKGTIVAMDYEFNDRLTSSYAKNKGKKECGKVVDAFCSVIKAAGYTPMLYANTSTFHGYLPDNMYKRYKIWVAQYASKCTYAHPYYLWQYTSSGRVVGITGNVDLNKRYVKIKKEKYKGTFPTLPKRGYFEKGDKGTNVKRVQEFLRWYGYSIAVDGSYGPKTAETVSKFEKAEGLKVDGSFGKKCLAKAREVMR